MLNELEIPIKTILSFVVNQSELKLISYVQYHKRSKHIDIMFHFLGDVFSRKEIEFDLYKTATKETVRYFWEND